MSTLLQVIAPFVDRKEAVAEALLVHALARRPTRTRFLALAGLGPEWHAAKVVPQVWSQDRSARHDIVLEGANGARFRIELKGYAKFTSSQQRVLAMGPNAGEDVRIDLLIVPRRERVPEWVHRGVRRLTWEEVDTCLGREVGSLSELWLGASLIEPAALLENARAYAAYHRGERPDATWNLLWQPFDYVPGKLPPSVAFNRPGGNRAGSGSWHYGAAFQFKKKWLWLGFVFRSEADEVTDLRLLLEDHNKKGYLEETRSRVLRRMYPSSLRAKEFWRAPDGEQLDLDRVARQLLTVLEAL